MISFRQNINKHRLDIVTIYCRLAAIFFLPLFLGVAPLHAKNYKLNIYQSFISDSMANWRTCIDEMHNQNFKSISKLEALINYQIGYIGWCIGEEKTKDAERYLKLAERNIDILEDLDENSASLDVFKGSLYGFKIGLNPIGTPYYGPRSVHHAKSAIQKAPDNPYGYILYANTQYYIWAFFGGSQSSAIVNYKKAEHLMEADSSEISQNWNYLSLLTMMAHVYEEMNKIHDAKLYYEKILRIEPRYVWVKDELYPELLKEIEAGAGK